LQGDEDIICHCEERSDAAIMSLRGDAVPAAIMSLRGDAVPAATSYIIVRLLRFARNDSQWSLSVVIVTFLVIARPFLCHCEEP